MNEFGTFDLDMLGISSAQIKEVDSSEAEVVSRVLMSRIKDIVATIRPDGITFNARLTEGFMPQDIAQGIESMALMSDEEKTEMARNARNTAEIYDFKNLTIKLEEVIKSLYS